MGEDDEHGRHVVVVGPCAAGKTTLVGNLRPRGYRLRSCAQEHSSAPRLWQRSACTVVLIYLDAELVTIARRQRRTDWTQARLDQQRRRLAHARAHCDLYLCTDKLTRRQVADIVASYLHNRGIYPAEKGEESYGDKS